MTISKERLAAMRGQYPVGTRIRLNEMNDPYSHLRPGSTGTLMLIDDIGTFHVKWDNGSTLGLIPGEDSFTALPPEQHSLRLWMPLTADLYQRDEWGDLDDEYEALDGYSLARYEGEIQEALENYVGEAEQERGLMHWYHGSDSVDQKVKSAFFNVELRDDRLWGVADCLVHGELTPEEIEQLKDYLSGQASDGWGEGFEQHEIHIDDGELYVHLWNSHNWYIHTEEEGLAMKHTPGLPDHCFSVLASTGELILLKRGESGYYHSTWSTDSREENERLADEGNERMNVTTAQRRAMEVGSMFGWDVPGADPREYEDSREQFEPEPQDPEDSGPVMSM